MWDELNSLNERMARAADKKAREQKLENRVTQLDQEQRAADGQARRLRQELAREEADVTRLEKTSLTNLFYTMLGSKDEQLYRERQEALAAQLKYDEAARRAEALQRELDQARKDLSDARYSGENYEALLQEKEALIERAPGAGASELMAFAERRQQLDWEAKELEEARSAGHRADGALAQVEDSLSSAQGWGTWDMLGGGMIATAVKHSRMDDAKHYAHHAQQALQAFRRELKDVSMLINVGDINLDGFTRFADYFFDGLIVDWVVQSRINESLNSVRSARQQVYSLIGHLERRLQDVQARHSALEIERQQFIAQFQG